MTSTEATRRNEIKKTLLKLKEFYENPPKELNEAETRYHLIDTFIEEVMGWPKQLVRVEGKSEAKKEYFDYLLEGNNSESKLVIEAKKTGVHFEIEDKNKELVNVHRFKTSKNKNDQDFYKAIVQAVSYARDHLARFAMVCNGHQIAVVLSQVEAGRPNEYGKALVFYSWDNLIERLDQFLDYLAFPELNSILPNLINLLAPKGGYVSTSHTLAYRISSYPRPFNKQIDPTVESMSTEIKNVCGVIIHGIAEKAFENNQTEDFLDHCYITPDKFGKEEADMVKWGKSFTKQFCEINNVQLQPALKKNHLNLDILNKLSEDPIIILGNVGVGKSIFIDYLINKDKNLHRDAYIARVRFTNVGSFDDAHEVKSIIALEIYESMKRGGYDCKSDGVLRDIYASDISEIEKNFKGASEETIAIQQGQFLTDRKKDIVTLVQDGLKRLKSLDGKKTIVFLDDIDQKSSATQREVYALARELMKSWKAHVSVITMTPLAFHTTKEGQKIRGPKSTGYNQLFSITAPPVTKVFEKRLEFIKKLIDESRLLDYGYNIEPHNKNTDDFLTTLLKELSPQGAIGVITGKLAGDNVRMATDIVKTYVEAKNTVVVKKRRGYCKVVDSISQNEYLLSLLKPDHSDYDEETSDNIINIFYVSENDPKEHFLSLAILSRLATTPNAGGSYHSVRDLNNWSKSYGFSENQIMAHLVRLDKNNLIEAVDLKVYSDISNGIAASYRIRPKGLYHVKLASNCTYVEEMLKVTPVFLSGDYELSTETEDLKKCIDNARNFCAYLIKVRKDSGVDADFLPPHILSKLEKSIEQKFNGIFGKQSDEINKDRVHKGVKELGQSKTHIQSVKEKLEH